MRVSTKPRDGRRLRLIAATVLGVDALVFLVVAVVGLAVDGYDSGVFVWLIAISILGLLAWVGQRWPGWAGACLLFLAFIGFSAAALGGPDSLAGWLLLLFIVSGIPLIAAILFLIARRIEGPSQRPQYVDDSADLWR